MDNENIRILPYIEYYEKKGWEGYPDSNTVIDRRTDRVFFDEDNDFAVGNSGGFLMKMNFKFINMHLFTEAARNYERNTRDPDIVRWVDSLSVSEVENRDKHFYCPHPIGSPRYNEFWRRETYRRRNGMTAKCKLLDTGEIVDLHITGDHYNYLNYGRIMRTPDDEETKALQDKGDYKTEQVEAFPRPWDGDYWNFKIDFFISRNNYHLAKGKARGKGYSYKRGSQAANTINLIRKSTIVLAAFDLSYLTDPGATSDMVKTNLDFYENSTHWKRFYIGENLSELQLGYRTKKGGAKKFGFLSRMLSVTTRNNESAAIGKRAIEIDYEEAGKAPNLEEFLDVTLSSTEVGAGNVGTIRVYGTAGTKEANWGPFANVFNNPRKYKMMPFENIWDYDGRNRICGFFHPQVLNMEPFMDEDGNSDLRGAWEYDTADKAQQAEELTVDKYITYVGQRANTPEEAFARGGENLFTSVELSKHLSQIADQKADQYFRDGMVIRDNDGVVRYVTNKQLIADNKATDAHPYIDDFPFNPKKDIYGCVREYYPPFIDEKGKVPSGLYCLTIDPVAKDKKSDTVHARNSLIAIQVWMLPNNVANSSGDLLVASYIGRPNTMAEGDRILLKLCEYYNGKAIVEVDRGETVSNFRKWGRLNRLYRDPTSILSAKPKEVSDAPYGLNMGSGTNALDGLEYLAELLYEKRAVSGDGKAVYTFHYIKDAGFLKELVGFSIDGNFDRISSARLYTFIRKALQVRRKAEIIKKARNRTKSIYEAIGLYNFK